MKRTTVSKSKPSAAGTRSVDARRLTAVRGGDGLGISVEVVNPPSSIMQMQHNELLIEL